MARSTCTVIESDVLCGKPINARKMCITHYKRWKKTGTTDAPPEKPRACGHERTLENTIVDKNGKRRCKPCREEYLATHVSEETCSREGCDRPVLAKGLCNRDYQRQRNKGSTDDRVLMTPEERHARRLAASNRWNAANREHVRQQSRERYWEDPEAERERVRNYRHRNPEKIAAYNRRWTLENPGRRTELARQWVASNPDAARANWSAKRARRLGLMRDSAEGPVSYVAVLAEHGMFCYLCAEEIAAHGELEYDHVIPLSRGGSHVESNIRPAHSWCNRWKSDRLLSELGIEAA